jgi:ribosomal protein L37AE/L43A
MNLSQCLDTLDLPRDATAVTFEDVKSAHRIMVQVWHPDKHTHNEKVHAWATNKMKEINAAWSELEAHFKAGNPGGVIARCEQVEVRRYKKTLKDFEKTVRCASCLNDTFVRDIRSLISRCDHCGYGIHISYHHTLSDYHSGLMWALDANIARKVLCRADAEEWFNKTNYSNYNDWRIPTKVDFSFVMRDLAKRSRFEDYHPYKNLQETPYWVAGDDSTGDMTWSVCIINGEPFDPNPAGSYSVWPVRIHNWER